MKSPRHRPHLFLGPADFVRTQINEKRARGTTPLLPEVFLGAVVAVPVGCSTPPLDLYPPSRRLITPEIGSVRARTRRAQFGEEVAHPVLLVHVKNGAAGSCFVPLIGSSFLCSRGRGILRLRGFLDSFLHPKRHPFLDPKRHSRIQTPIYNLLPGFYYGRSLIRRTTRLIRRTIFAPMLLLSALMCGGSTPDFFARGRC